jgi:hypothetical protein
MAKKKAAALPKKIYVVRVRDGDESWFNADDALYDLADKDETRIVGTYELVEQGTLEVKAEYKRK